MKTSKESVKKQANKHNANNDQEVSWWQPSVVLFGRLSGWIAFPVILALFVGKWLDQKYQTEPWLFLLSVGLAFVTSSIGIVKEASVAMKSISDSEKKDK
jgi:hypothetical protein